MILSGLIGCAVPRLPSHYSAESIEAWVVDAETKEPLEDVIVVANWALRGGWIEHEVGSLQLVETVTDKDGRFFSPAWGPKRRPISASMEMLSDPRALLFKPGYRWKKLYNPPSPRESESKIRPFEWNGKTVEMERFTKTIGEYQSDLNSYKTHLYSPDYTSDCIWKKIPRATVAVAKQKLELIRRSRGQSEVVPREELFKWLMQTLTKSNGSDPCGAEEFLQEFIQLY